MLLDNESTPVPFHHYTYVATSPIINVALKYSNNMAFTLPSFNAILRRKCNTVYFKNKQLNSPTY